MRTFIHAGLGTSRSAAQVTSRLAKVPYWRVNRPGGMSVRLLIGEHANSSDDGGTTYVLTFFSTAGKLSVNC